MDFSLKHFVYKLSKKFYWGMLLAYRIIEISSTLELQKQLLS